MKKALGWIVLWITFSSVVGILLYMFSNTPFWYSIAYGFLGISGLGAVIVLIALGALLIND